MHHKCSWIVKVPHGPYLDRHLEHLYWCHVDEYRGDMWTNNDMPCGQIM